MEFSFFLGGLLNQQASLYFTLKMGMVIMNCGQDCSIQWDPISIE
jgi:hypothetical protein